MSVRIDELAEQVASLGPSEQEELLEKVADLNFRHGLEALSRKYRKRLAAAGKLNQKADEVMAKLEHIRERIADKEQGVPLEEDPILKVVGTCLGGPKDGADQHDHYIYGSPKR